ncbi:MAG: AAA family ATPase [Meiothermus sp.]|nr:AAA family ATPase [Meiothermus sp.]
MPTTDLAEGGLTLEQAAKRLGVSPSTVSRYLQLNRLVGAYRTDSGYFIPKDVKVSPTLRTAHIPRLHRYAWRAEPLVVAVWNQAGGAGKTTLCREIAFLAGQWGLRVLVCDLDAQANLTSWSGVEEVALGDTLYEFIAKEGALPPAQERHGYELYPSGLAFDAVNSELTADLMLAAAQGRAGTKIMRLRQALRAMPKDLILLDGPPNITPIVTAMLLAAHELILPVEVGRKGLEGADAVLQMLNSAKGFGAVPLRPRVVVPTKFSPSVSEAHGYLATLQNLFAAEITAPLNLRVSPYSSAQTHAVPLGVADASSLAAAEMIEVAESVLGRLGFKELS